MKQNLTKSVILYIYCIVCKKKIKPVESMKDILCSTCKEKKDNVGMYAGSKCSRGHSLIFQHFIYPDKYEPYCKICRSFCIKVKSRTPKEKQ